MRRLLAHAAVTAALALGTTAMTAWTAGRSGRPKPVDLFMPHMNNPPAPRDQREAGRFVHAGREQLAPDRAVRPAALFASFRSLARRAAQAAGERQARAVADHLAGEPLAGLFVTPLRRTAQTAAPLAAVTGLEPVVVPELREVHLGELDGGAFRIAVARRDPRVAEVFEQQRWDVIPGAETMAAFEQRTRAGIDRILAG